MINLCYRNLEIQYKLHTFAVSKRKSKTKKGNRYEKVDDFINDVSRCSERFSS